MDEPEEFNDEIDDNEEQDIESNASDEDNDLEQISDIINDDNINDDDDDDDDYNDLEQTEINKEEVEELTSVKSDIYKSSFIFNDDLEASDSHDFLQKFDRDLKNDFIASNHQECLSRNLDEIKNFINVIRDKNNIIIDELHKTVPFLTKYEKTRILGIRLKQLNNGSLPYVKVAEDILDNFLIAEKELKQKKLPFIIQRPLPNNTFEFWKLQDLEIL